MRGADLPLRRVWVGSDEQVNSSLRGWVGTEPSSDLCEQLQWHREHRPPVISERALMAQLRIMYNTRNVQSWVL